MRKIAVSAGNRAKEKSHLAVAFFRQPDDCYWLVPVVPVVGLCELATA